MNIRDELDDTRLQLIENLREDLKRNDRYAVKCKEDTREIYTRVTIQGHSRETVVIITAERDRGENKLRVSYKTGGKAGPPDKEESYDEEERTPELEHLYDRITRWLENGQL